MNKCPELTATTKNTFIEAFCELYEKTEIEKITVKELTKKAGYSRATFYNYFCDVYDLLEYIENEFIQSLMNRITHNIERQQPLENFVHDFVELISSKQRYINVFINGCNSAAFVNKLKHEAMPLLLTAFHISPDNFSARYTLEFYISGLLGVLGVWLKNNQDMPMESLAILIKEILQEGILKQLQ
ncbi:MAG: TetR/AcrR family transcriptional regulator [Peptococcaceae bacterium]|nr:TetR/AcrR family transcriptional regulator [Peptococcaceae bacterium]MBQ3119768.1 TetR/AcrR family transcriptional regulator [Peptococcaceae bacterium]